MNAKHDKSSGVSGATFAFLVAVMLVFPLPVFAQNSGDTWEYHVTPYLWLPTIDGSMKYGIPPGSGSGGGPEFSVGPTDWFDLLNFGLLVSGSAKKGRFSLMTDFVYLSMTSKNDSRIERVHDGSAVIPIDASLQVDARTDLDGLNLTFAAGLDIGESESGSATIFAGIRYFDFDVENRWNLSAAITGPNNEVLLPAEGSRERDVSLLDGIVGIRGQFGKAESKWAVPYYLDVGTGDSDLTWNLMAGAAREFRWGDLLIMYRHLEYDQDSDSLLQDFSFSGPAIGVRFNF